jgi:hypothetical protein
LDGGGLAGKEKAPTTQGGGAVKKQQGNLFQASIYIGVYTYVGEILRKNTKKTNITIKRRNILSSTQEHFEIFKNLVNFFHFKIL